MWTVLETSWSRVGSGPVECGRGPEGGDERGRTPCWGVDAEVFRTQPEAVVPQGCGKPVGKLTSARLSGPGFDSKDELGDLIVDMSLCLHL